MLMNKLVLLVALVVSLASLASPSRSAQTIGLFHLQGAYYPGYTLFSPLAYPGCV